MKCTRKVQRKVCPELGELRGRGVFIICKGILSSNERGLLILPVVNVFGKDKIMTLNTVNVAQNIVHTVSIKTGHSNIYLVKNNGASSMVIKKQECEQSEACMVGVGNRGVRMSLCLLGQTR